MSVMRMDVPVGTILDFAGSDVPGGYLECDGSAVSRTLYPLLFAAIGTAWGAGDGSTTFNLPDFRGRTAIGAGSGTGGNATAHALASMGGDEKMQSHNHTQNGHSHPQVWLYDNQSSSYSVPASCGYVVWGTGIGWNTTARTNWNVHHTGYTNTVTPTNNPTGGGSSENMQPFATVRKVIRAA